MLFGRKRGENSSGKGGKGEEEEGRGTHHLTEQPLTKFSYSTFPGLEGKFPRTLTDLPRCGNPLISYVQLFSLEARESDYNSGPGAPRTSQITRGSRGRLKFRAKGAKDLV